MSETRILYLSYQPSDNSIDFGLLGAPLTDSLIASKRKEIAECLRDLAKRLDSREYPFCNLFARLADGQPTFYEDQLPDDMTDGEYAAWFAQSKVVDGVRMGPEFPPAQVTHHCPACEAAARERDAAYEDSRQMQQRLQRLIDANPDVADLHALCDRQADILSRVAVALRGPEPPQTRWSHADLPERAAEAARELADAADEIARLRTLKDAEPGQWNAALELADLRARIEARLAFCEGSIERGGIIRAADEARWLRALLAEKEASYAEVRL